MPVVPTVKDVGADLVIVKSGASVTVTLSTNELLPWKGAVSPAAVIVVVNWTAPGVPPGVANTVISL